MPVTVLSLSNIKVKNSASNTHSTFIHYNTTNLNTILTIQASSGTSVKMPDGLSNSDPVACMPDKVLALNLSHYFSIYR